MTATMQATLAAIIVLVATVYAALMFMPAAWRRGLAGRAAAMAARWGVSEANARRVEAKLASGGACGSCDSCKACAAPHEKDGLAALPSGSFKQIPIRAAR